MPANLTPQYLAAEAAFKEAKTVEEKRLALEEMLATIPKHKGTEKLQAEIKSRLAKLRQDEGERHGVKGADPFHVPKEGAGQVVLVGFPNVGKSALVSALTRAHATVGDYPFTTSVPLAGMMPFEDIRIQLIDTPPIAADEIPIGLAGTLRLADLLLVVVDLASDDCLAQVEGTLAQMRARHILRGEDEEPTPHTKVLRDCLFVGAKADADGSADRLAVLAEIMPAGHAIQPVSTRTRAGLDILPCWVFTMLRVIRIYSKVPGREADRNAPFTLKQGSTILDMAAAVHRDFPERLKSARVWGSSRFPGAAVPRDHVLVDRDVVELHI